MVLVMNDENKHQNIDKDIAQSKKDVLKASDIIPFENKSEKNSEKDNVKIPNFDLARHLTNNRRQKASGRRKSPLSRTVSDQKHTTSFSSGRSYINLNKENIDTPEQKLISRIVARDINRWYDAAS
jgi:hypothetical protein